MYKLLLFLLVLLFRQVEYEDAEIHQVSVSQTLESGKTYLLWIGIDPDGDKNDNLYLVKTHVVLVPRKFLFQSLCFSINY